MFSWVFYLKKTSTHQHLSWRLLKLLNPKRLEMSEDFSPLKKERHSNANKHSQTLRQCYFNNTYHFHLQPSEIFTCMTRWQNMQLFLLTIQFVKITCQISYTTCNTCPLRAIRASPANITVPSAQWFSRIDQKQYQPLFSSV